MWQKWVQQDSLDTRKKLKKEKEEVQARAIEEGDNVTDKILAKNSVRGMMIATRNRCERDAVGAEDSVTPMEDPEEVSAQQLISHATPVARLAILLKYVIKGNPVLLL